MASRVAALAVALADLVVVVLVVAEAVVAAMAEGDNSFFKFRIRLFTLT